MGPYNVELLPAAYSDLDEIFSYIMVDNPTAATMILEKIMDSLHRLEIYPNSGVPLVDKSLSKFQFRMVIVDPYLAFYRFLDNKVIVYRILHGASAYLHLLKSSF